MKILHTADWHLGASLANHRRTNEQQAFLHWLINIIASEHINALIIAGDLFDSTTPPHSAQEQYFHFLSQLAALPDFRHAIIVSGNHDSPSLLDAPATMLNSLNIHVIGNAKSQAEQAILTLKNPQGEDELIICAIPYLRERDVRTSQAGETQSDKNQKVIHGTAAYYAATFQAACVLRGNRPIPIIATGHLFCTSSSLKHIEPGDGVRELYVGTLNRFPAELFPPFDYIALGHLHIAQTIQNQPLTRYSGSPIQMGFGECTQNKTITLLHFPPQSCQAHVSTLNVPIFQKLAKCSGDLNEIQQQIQALPPESVWLEIHYTGAEHIADLRTTLEHSIAHTPHRILKIRNHHTQTASLNQQHQEDTLENINIHQVFERCLTAHHIPPEQQTELIYRYHQAIKTLEEHDPCESPASHSKI